MRQGAGNSSILVLFVLLLKLATAMAPATVFGKWFDVVKVCLIEFHLQNKGEMYFFCGYS